MTGRLLRRLAAALLLLAGAAAPALAQYAPPWQGQGVPALTAPAAAPAVRVAAVRMVGLTVSDLDRSVAFYTEVLGFEPDTAYAVADPAYGRLLGLAAPRLRVARLRLGDERLELTEFVAPPGRPAPGGPRSHDRWFQHVAIVVRDMERAAARLHARGVRLVSAGPQRLPDWNPSAGGIEALYFRDPDGHPLELLRFPPAKGLPKWHRPGDRLFLGIDHTAIVVRDTEASLDFWQDLLGLRVAGTSENYGPEQERLSAVPGAHVRITSLRAPAGPGVEFLEYLAPRDGRPAPRDARPNDLVHWETTVAIGDAARAHAALRRTGADGLSPLVRLADGTLRFLARDPDGHAVQFLQLNGFDAAEGPR